MSKIPALAHLKRTALRLINDSTSRVAELAQSTADALDEMNGAKQDKLTGAAGQVVGFDSAGNAAAQNNAAAYVAGRYTGTGLSLDDGGLAVTLGFRPSFLIISRGWCETGSAPDGFFCAGEVMPSEVTDTVFRFTSTGFRVGEVYDGTSYLHLNEETTAYCYIAFQ